MPYDVFFPPKKINKKKQKKSEKKIKKVLTENIVRDIFILTR